MKWEIIQILQLIGIILSVIFSGLNLYLFWKARPKKVQQYKSNQNSFVINWSGHPLPDNTKWIEEKGIKVWTPKEPPNFNSESWENLIASIRKHILKLPIDLRKRVLRGDPDIIFVIPQFAPALALFLAIFHGISGSFPTITSPMRGEGGSFFLPEPINLSELRFQARKDRELQI